MKISRYSDRQSGVLFPIQNALPDTGTTPPLLMKLLHSQSQESLNGTY
ncbi:hypothetical protein [Laspinema olomoucense]|uniref:Uncharacterized protein n=1 Tax=Laspinema olomoucense D3b TaxID=2953688 RepID=A0ABT2N6I9_9CYAN|nr:hypothetical protein [Laspinema sp. D3b]MCT7978313.1 hypothetical protein [Laspinema sp. D3b]